MSSSPKPALTGVFLHRLSLSLLQFHRQSNPSHGEPWCVAQGQVDGNVFLSYDCGGTMIQSTSPLGEKVKTTNTWETQRQTLRDIGDFLMGQLPDFIPEKHTARGEFGSVPSLSRVPLFATPWTAARQASLSFTNSQRLLKLMSIKSNSCPSSPGVS